MIFRINPYPVLCLLFSLCSLNTASFAAIPTLKWDAPTTNTDGSPLNNLTNYRVKISTMQGTYDAASVSDIPSNQTEFALQNLQTGTVYFFVVVAVNSNGEESSPSNEVTYTMTEPRIGGGIDDNPNSVDDDSDGVLDTADNCRAVSNSSQSDLNNNGIGDACEVKSTLANDFDGDKNSDFLLSSSKGFFGYYTVLNSQVVNSFVGTTKKTKLSSGDVNSDGAAEVLAALKTSRQFTWTAYTSDGKVVKDLGKLGGTSDIPLTGCFGEGSALPLVMSGSGKKLSRIGKSISFQTKLASAKCTSGTTSKIIGIERQRSSSYLTTVSMAGKVLGRALLPKGISGVKFVSVPAFGERDEVTVVLGKVGRQFNLYKLNSNRNSLERLTVTGSLGTVKGISSGAFEGRFGFVSINVGKSLKIIPIDGPSRVIDLAHLSSRSGGSLVE